MDFKTQNQCDSNAKLKKDDRICKPVDLMLYQSMVGNLLYAAVATRSDIFKTVEIVSQNLQKLTYLTAVKRILH